MVGITPENQHEQSYYDMHEYKISLFEGAFTNITW